MKIISIASVMGGGKTTTVNALLNQIPRATAIYFDSYEFEDSDYDYSKWVNEGADYNKWKLEPLEKDIKKTLKNTDFDYIFLDYPFAYANKLIAPYIDIAIFIDTPLDIALSRSILRDMSFSSGKAIRKHLSNYLDFARPAFLQMEKDIMPISDFVIDGTLSTQHIVQKVIETIKL